METLAWMMGGALVVLVATLGMLVVDLARRGDAADE